MLPADTICVEHEQQKQATHVYSNFPVLGEKYKIIITFQHCPTNESQEYRRAYVFLQYPIIFYSSSTFYPPVLATKAYSHPPSHQRREAWHLQATGIHYTQKKVTFSHFFFSYAAFLKL